MVLTKDETIKKDSMCSTIIGKNTVYYFILGYWFIIYTHKCNHFQLALKYISERNICLKGQSSTVYAFICLSYMSMNLKKLPIHEEKVQNAALYLHDERINIRS